jgi:hypothetical protein
MPQRSGEDRVMVAGQRGSILAGVLAMSMVMSLSAAGLLLVAANSRNDEDMAFRRAGCYLDAESGLMLGAAWLKIKGTGYISQNQGWGGNLKTFPAILLDNKSVVTVKITDNNTSKTLTSNAVNGTESAQFSWDIGVDNTVNPPAITLKNWRTP